MGRLSRSISALGTPVASLILLVVAVLLSTITAFVAISTVNTRVQGKEHLSLTKCHMWFKNGTFSIGGIAIVNTGATDVVLSQIAVNGQDCTWNGTTTYALYNKTAQGLSGELPYIETLDRNGTSTIQIGYSNYTFRMASDDLILQRGWTIVVYIANPGDLMVYNVGREVNVVVTTAQAVWCTETIVKAAAT